MIGICQHRLAAFRDDPIADDDMQDWYTEWMYLECPRCWLGMKDDEEWEVFEV